jgi:hypothetical protein
VVRGEDGPPPPPLEERSTTMDEKTFFLHLRFRLFGVTVELSILR